MPKITAPTQFDSSCVELENLIERLQNLSRSRASKRILICPTDDLLAKNVSREIADSVLLTAFLNPQHSFQLLTNQPVAALKYLTQKTLHKRLEKPIKEAFKAAIENALFEMPKFELPIPNLLIGAKIENQKQSLEIRNSLQEIALNGWQTWVSCEPMSAPMTFSAEWKFLKWIVVGGESDKISHPIHPHWLRTTRDFCAKNKIAFFFKSWGDWLPKSVWEESLSSKNSGKKWNQFDWGSLTLNGDFHQYSLPNPLRSRDECLVLKIGKAKTKNILDGEAFHQFPE